MSDLVQLTNIDGIAVVTISNPPVNALSSAVSAGIAAAVAHLSQGLRFSRASRRLGNWWEPAPLLQRLAEQGKTFAEFTSRQGAAA
jgi:predicted nucleic acid-binding Zn ribbon protein